MPTVNYGIPSTADDISETRNVSDGAAISYFDSFTYTGLDGQHSWAGLRFTGIAVPAGATITSATLTLKRDDGLGSTGSNWGILKGYAADTVGALTSNRPYAAAKTTASVTVINSATVPYDVTAIVAEITGRPGWSTGNNLAFASVPTGSNGYLGWIDRSASSVNCAQLSITYTTGPTASTGTLTKTLGSLTASSVGTNDSPIITAPPFKLFRAFPQFPSSSAVWLNGASTIVNNGFWDDAPIIERIASLNATLGGATASSSGTVEAVTGGGREAVSVEADAETSTTSTTDWSDLSTFSDPLTAGDWLLLSTRRYAHSSASGLVDLRLVEDDVEVYNTRIRARGVRADFYPSSAFMHRIQSSGGAKSVKTQLKTGSTGTAYSDDGRLVFLKLGENDLWAESLTRQTTTSTTPQVAVSVTATVDAGDYVLVAFGITDSNASQAPTYVSVACDGDVSPEIGSISTVAGAVGPTLMVRKFTLAAGEHTFDLRYRAHSSTTSGMAEARVCVLKASDFANVYYEQLDADDIGTNTTYTEVLSVSPTVTATPHILLMSCATSAALTNTAVLTQLTVAGVVRQESLNRSYNAGTDRSSANPYVRLSTPEAGPRTYALSRRSDQDVTATRVKAGAAIAVFDLGAGGAPPEPTEVIATVTATLGGLTSSSGTGISVQASATKALDAATVSSSSAALITAAVSKTLGSLALLSNVSIVFPGINGALNKSLGTMVGSSSVVLPVAAAITTTLGSLSTTSEIDVALAASLDRSLGLLTTASAVGVATTANVTASLAALSASSSVAAIAGLSLSKTLGVATVVSSSAIGLGATTTKTLGSLASSSATSVSLLASTSKTLGSVTSIASTTAIAGASTNATLGAVAGTSSAVAPTGVYFNKTLGVVATTSAGTSSVSASLAKTLESIQLNSLVSQEEQRVADLDKTLGAMSSSSSGTSSVSATVTKTLGAVTTTAQAGAAVRASTSKTLGSATSTGTVRSTVGASVSKTLGGITSTGTVAALVQSALVGQLAPATSSSDTDVVVVATATKTLGSITLVSDGGALSGLNGSLNKTLGSMTSSSDSDILVQAETSAEFSPVTSNSSSSVEIKISSNAILAPLSAEIVSKSIIGAEASNVLSTLTGSSQAKAIVGAASDTTFDPMTGSSEGVAIVTATASVSLGELTLSSTAKLITVNRGRRLVMIIG